MSTKWTATNGRGNTQAVFEGDRLAGYTGGFSPGDLAMVIAAPEMLATLKRARAVLSAYHSTSVFDGECAEDYNNEDVIEVDDEIAALIARIDGAK
jgi:hypothetical protein